MSKQNDKNHTISSKLQASRTHVPLAVVDHTQQQYWDGILGNDRCVQRYPTKGSVVPFGPRHKTYIMTEALDNNLYPTITWLLPSGIEHNTYTSLIRHHWPHDTTVIPANATTQGQGWWQSLTNVAGQCWPCDVWPMLIFQFAQNHQYQADIRPTFGQHQHWWCQCFANVFVNISLTFANLQLRFFHKICLLLIRIIVGVMWVSWIYHHS